MGTIIFTATDKNGDVLQVERSSDTTWLRNIDLVGQAFIAVGLSDEQRTGLALALLATDDRYSVKDNATNAWLA